MGTFLGPTGPCDKGDSPARTRGSSRSAYHVAQAYQAPCCSGIDCSQTTRNKSVIDRVQVRADPARPMPAINIVSKLFSSACLFFHLPWGTSKASRAPYLCERSSSAAHPRRDASERSGRKGTSSVALQNALQQRAATPYTGAHEPNPAPTRPSLSLIHI